MGWSPVSHNANAEQRLSMLLGDAWLPLPLPAEAQHLRSVPKYTRVLPL